MKMGKDEGKLRKDERDAELGGVKKVVFWAGTFAVAFLLLEVLSSVLLLYRYRFTRHDLHVFRSEPSYLSSVNLLHKAAGRLGLIDDRWRGSAGEYEYEKRVSPNPFIVDDERLGYRALHGAYTHEYLRRKIPDGAWESFKVNVTMNPDGTRWTGDLPDSAASAIYVFGDSFVFGSGVHDEQTFSYHVQQAFPDQAIRLYALGGYGLPQSYLRYNTIRGEINCQDTIILGYADFYDVRTVVDPEYLRTRVQWLRKYSPSSLSSRGTKPRALLSDNGDILIDYVEVNCEFNDGYCERPSFSEAEMAKTSAALVNFIANDTCAKVYLLHFEGDKEEVRAFLNAIDDRVEVVSATPADFESFIRDDIEGFDPHPGPYWHYAISKKLIDTLRE